MMHQGKSSNGACKRDQAEVAAKVDCGSSLLAIATAG